MVRKSIANPTFNIPRIGETGRQSLIPSIGTATAKSTSSPVSSMINRSYSKILGGESGLGKNGLGAEATSMKQLQSESMQLADAASMRGISEREAEEELQAKKSGFNSFREMQMDAERKRREEEYAEKMRSMGLTKFGSGWIKQ